MLLVEWSSHSIISTLKLLEIVFFVDWRHFKFNVVVGVLSWISLQKKKLYGELNWLMNNNIQCNCIEKSLGGTVVLQYFCQPTQVSYIIV